MPPSNDFVSDAMATEEELHAERAYPCHDHRQLVWRMGKPFWLIICFCNSGRPSLGGLSQ